MLDENMKNPNQSFRKNLRAFFIALVLTVFLVTFFNLIGSLIIYVTLISGFSLFGWIVGGSVTIYLIVSGLLKSIFTSLISAAEIFSNAIADGYYDSSETV